MGQLANNPLPALGTANYMAYATALDADARTDAYREVTGATTLVATDGIVAINSATAVTQPVPSGLGSIEICQLGLGQVTLSAGTGVTLTGRLKTSSQYSSIVISPRGSTTSYLLRGGVA